MTSVAIIEKNTISGKFRATYLAVHSSNGTKGESANCPQDALRALADELDREDERLELLRAIDNQGD